MEINNKAKRGSLIDALTPLRIKRSRNDVAIQSSVRSNGAETVKKCYFNDPIHGNIAISGLCLQIIDTRQFQRLRDLKQLGTCDYVYYGATHTRFSHSIGVAHYAEKVVRNLIKNQPHLHITEADVLSVTVAGLCHDLGHGPFSHVFDGVFMARMHPHTKSRHEDWSVNIFKYLIQANNIDLSVHGLSPQDELFITEIISGTPESQRRGREADKFYLYDIVNNSRSGLDVDKLDYFQRDIKHTNVDTNYNQFQRFLEFGRVMRAESLDPPIVPVPSPSYLLPSPEQLTPSPPVYMICYPEKMVGEALQLFTLRYQLHQKVYTHKAVKKLEYMLVDALVLADPFLRIPGSVTSSHLDGQYRMSECHEDPAAMCNLTDSVVYLIETSTREELKPAREILDRIRRRDFVSHIPTHLRGLLTVGDGECSIRVWARSRLAVDRARTATRLRLSRR
jgi:HD superfamily phosphohydrolase